MLLAAVNFFFFQAEDGIRDRTVTGVKTCALPIFASADKGVEENRRAALRFGEVFLSMRRVPKPVVALVRGRALAGGCELATACDLVLAAESAQFGYPEVQRGFVPAIVMTLLKRTAGEKVAFDLAATGRILGATEA